MPMVRKTDTVSKELLKRKLNFVGIEALFSDEHDPIVSDEHIAFLHKNSLAIWAMQSFTIKRILFPQDIPMTLRLRKIRITGGAGSTTKDLIFCKQIGSHRQKTILTER